MHQNDLFRLDVDRLTNIHLKDKFADVRQCSMRIDVGPETVWNLFNHEMWVRLVKLLVWW